MKNETADQGRRIGGDVVLESLIALGAEAVVGLPGQHALGLFDALRRSEIAYLSARVENNAGFMADGLARVTGKVAPLLLSTGPGALTSVSYTHLDVYKRQRLIHPRVGENRAILLETVRYGRGYLSSQDLVQPPSLRKRRRGDHHNLFISPLERGHRGP